MTKISIAMATYNGAQYLKEQLESLVNQTYCPFELVVCDDGSSDNTVEIIQEFSKKAPFPVQLFINENNLGYGDNFLKAAKLCKGDWVAFSDQDDVWMPNRLEDVRLAIQKDERAILIIQYAYICDENLTQGGRLFPDLIKCGYNAPGSRYSFWVWLGFLQTVRRDVFCLGEDIQRPRSYFYPDGCIQPHDKWTCMIANTIGGFYVIDKVAALYRRHDAALTGYYEPQSLMEKVKKSLPVSSEHYQILSDIAEESMAYQNLLMEQEGSKYKSNFEQSAQSFLKISKIQSARANLYSTQKIFSRMKYFSQILTIGGYIGPRRYSIGWKSGLKDILRVIWFL